jgi:dCMP deaminase
MISKEEELSMYRHHQKVLTTRRKQRDWDLYFLNMLDMIASKSPDPRTKVGCLIIGEDNELLSTGYNGFPRGVEPTTARLDNEEKLYWMVHAENNAVLNAARHGTRLKGSTAYTPFIPCPVCAGAFIQAGIKTIVMYLNSPNLEHTARWADKYKRSAVMLKEAGIKIRRVNID